jgi:hypothetical protein
MVAYIELAHTKVPGHITFVSVGLLKKINTKSVSIHLTVMMKIIRIVKKMWNNILDTLSFQES